jgi:hypothetical protein
MVFLVETHTAGFEDGMLLFFVNQVAAQASLFGNLPTDSAEEPQKCWASTLSSPTKNLKRYRLILAVFSCHFT